MVERSNAIIEQSFDAIFGVDVRAHIVYSDEDS